MRFWKVKERAELTLMLKGEGTSNVTDLQTNGKCKIAFYMKCPC
jgi:hypothetical protein